MSIRGIQLTFGKCLAWRRKYGKFIMDMYADHIIRESGVVDDHVLSEPSVACNICREQDAGEHGNMRGRPVGTHGGFGRLCSNVERL